MESISFTSHARVAVAGVGYWGKNLVRNFAKLGALAALCDAKESVETTYGCHYPDVTFYREYSAMLMDSSINAVALATPAVTHFELAKAALEAGKDVLVEKPLAVDVNDGEELVHLAEAKG